MNTIQTAYVNALLADASYIKGITKGNITESSDFLKRLTQSQFAFLAANFTVKSSVETPNTINSELGTGFDAVVWEGKAGTPYAGQTYVSMRGTQGGTDIADDASLASKGLPCDQIRDTVNWWLKSTASTTDQNVVRINVADIPGAVIGKTFALDTPTTGTGVLSVLGSINAVNGHSLGGCGDTSKQPSYSDNWYTDRAAMLQALVTRNEKDLTGNVLGQNRYRLNNKRLPCRKNRQKRPLALGIIGFVAMNFNKATIATCKARPTGQEVTWS